MSQDQYCFVGLKALIVKNGKVLVLSNVVHEPDLPGGKIQEGETDIPKALQREVKEETGLKIKVKSPFSVWMYTIPRNLNHKNTGKKIFTISFLCTYVSGVVKLSPEHESLMWVDRSTYKKYVRGSNFEKTFDMYFG